MGWNTGHIKCQMWVTDETVDRATYNAIQKRSFRIPNMRMSIKA